jgi:hypothetical protein
MAFAQDQRDGESYQDKAKRLLTDVEQSFGQHPPTETAAVANAWALLAIHERLTAIEFQLSQMPRG